nr:MAG TPA: PGDYG protein [Caudoviricetes sp.]
MTKYVKKPVKVNAWQLTSENIEAGMPDWLDLDKIHIFSGGAPFAEIETLEGLMTASYGDYIIQGVKGEFYPCKPDIFLATYEKAPVLLKNGDEDYSVLDDITLTGKLTVAKIAYQRLSEEAYKRTIEKQVEGKGVVFGKSVITIEGMKGEYLVADMATQLSRASYVPFPMLALHRIKVNGEVSKSLQYTNQTHPVITVIGEYAEGTKGGVVYD